MRSPRSASAVGFGTALGLFLGTSTASAQQFSFSGSLPGGFEWTEGVEAADVDQDGDADLFTANGEGLYNPSTQRQAGLIINQLEVGPGLFSDESVARLGVALSNGKNVNTADVDGDGWIDALYSNAFFTDPPFLFVNRGAAQPGFFDEEGAARGLTTAFSSAGASFGDVDNDGDLDLLIGDTGPVFNGPPGGRPQLYFNDGTGSFTQAPALPTPLKVGHLDVDFVDIDLDWDLDIYSTNRGNSPGGIHHLLLNDGTGQFTDASSAIPNTSNNVYESDLADLDGDTDMDLFFLSLSGFNDGGMRNNVVETGSLSFSPAPPLGGDDDNEVAFIDYDMDGDLDVIIGSLGPTEKLVRNNGGSFTQLTTAISNVNDRTLDVAIVDLDNDADYDLVTVQGESSSATWDNKIYLNSGPVDDRAPVVQRLEELTDPSPAGPWVLRAQVKDEVHDDGRTWVTAQGTYRVDVGAVAGTPVTVDAQISYGAQYRFQFDDTAAGAGTRLVYSLTFTDAAGNATTTDEVVVPLIDCGFATYGAGTAAHTLTLTGLNPGTLGFNVDLFTTGANADTVLTGVAGAPAEVPFAGGLLLIDANQLIELAVLPVFGGGSLWVVQVPDDAAFVGVPFYFQSIAADAGQPGGLAFSNGVSLVPCE
jgi:hypothetical protein